MPVEFHIYSEENDLKDSLSLPKHRQVSLPFHFAIYDNAKRANRLEAFCHLCVPPEKRGQRKHTTGVPKMSKKYLEHMKPVYSNFVIAAVINARLINLATEESKFRNCSFQNIGIFLCFLGSPFQNTFYVGLQCAVKCRTTYSFIVKGLSKYSSDIRQCRERLFIRSTKMTTHAMRDTKPAAAPFLFLVFLHSQGHRAFDGESKRKSVFW